MPNCSARTFSTVLNRSVKSGDPYLVQDLGELSSFYHLILIVAMGLSHMTFIMLSCVPFISLFFSFYQERALNFCQMFFSASVDIII